MKNLTTAVLFSGVLAFLSTPLFSIERELLLFMDIPVVVTASKTEQPITEAPATIDIITSREIEDLGLRTLADALRLVPGMDIMSQIFTVYASPRGMNDRRLNSSILCLIDGHPFNEVTRGTIDPLWVSLSNVKRIEVIKGPGSALYGANAFTGVINIITKTPEDINGLSAAIGAGTHNTATQELVYGRRHGDIGTVLTFWHYGTDAMEGHSIIDNDDRDDLKLFAKVSGKHLSVSADYYRARLGLPGTTISPSPTFRANVDQKFATVDYYYDLSPETRIKFLLHFLATHQTIDDAAIGPTEAYGTRLGGETQLDYRPSSHHTLIGGIEWKRESNDSAKMGGAKTIDTKALYLQEEWRPVDKLIFTFGGRYDLPSAYEKVFSPRANITYKYSPRTVFKTSYGEAFRAPNFFELFVDVRFITFYRILGNPHLVPERIRTTEVGVSHQFSPAAQASLNLFHIRTSNTMTLDYSVSPGGPGGSTINLVYKNKTNAQIQGGETALKYRVSKGLDTSFFYAYQNAEDLDIGRELSLAPRHKLGMKLDMAPADKLKINTYTYYASRKIDSWSSQTARELDPYTITNCSISYGISKELGISLTAFNLFDASYEELKTTPLGGRSIFAEIKYTF